MGVWMGFGSATAGVLCLKWNLNSSLGVKSNTRGKASLLILLVLLS